MESTDLCPHPLTRQDAAALIGVLARLEALTMTGSLDGQDVDAFRGRLVRDGVMTADDQDLTAALNRLNHSVRTALGEYD